MYHFSIINDGIALHLRARMESWAAGRDQRANLLGAYNVRVSECTNALARVLDVLSNEAVERRAEPQPNVNYTNPDVLRNFNDLIYRLAEAYDFFRGLSDALDAKKTNKSDVRKYKGIVREVARTACLICNKIKHDNNVLGRVDNFYDAGVYVEGFALYSRNQNATLEISRELHETKKPGISFNIGLRSLVFDLLRADVAAGRLCSVLGAGEIELPDAELTNSLRHLSGRPVIGLRFEADRMIPTIWEQSGNWVLGKRARKLPYLGKKVEVIQTMSGDGYTKTFPIAG